MRLCGRQRGAAIPATSNGWSGWLWNLEDPYDEMEKSIEAARQYWGLTPDDLGDRLLMNVAADGDAMRLAFIGEAGFQLDLALLGWIAGELTENGIDYFHFDPFVSAHGLDENSNTEIDQLAKALSIMSHQTHTATGLSHHTSKSGSINVTTHSARGAVSLTDACRSVITLNRMNDDEASGYGIEGKDARRYFNTYQDKGNRSAAADRVTWFQWKSVDLGNGGRDPVYEIERESDSVGVVAPWTPPDAFDGVTRDHLLRVQGKIADGDFKEHAASSPWAGEAIAEVLEIDLDTAANKKRVANLLKQWVNNGALRRVVKRDPKKREDRWFIEVGKPVD